jgi:hypothetical protein
MLVMPDFKSSLLESCFSRRTFLKLLAVLYSQYPAWVVPLLPMVFLDFEANRIEQSEQLNELVDQE